MDVPNSQKAGQLLFWGEEMSLLLEATHIQYSLFLINRMFEHIQNEFALCGIMARSECSMMA